MLTFHGIEYGADEIPRKFTKTYFFSKSLKKFLALYRKYEGNQEKVLKKVENQLGRIYSTNSTDLNPSQKNEVAQLLRIKDLLIFVGDFYSQQRVILAVFSLLAESLPIEQKWIQILNIFKEFRSEIFVAGYGIELSDSNSLSARLLGIARLIFWEQDEEKPPANLLLKFVPKKFPTFELISTDKKNSAEIGSWSPKNFYCKQVYLHNSLLHRLLDADQKQIESQSDKVHFPASFPAQSREKTEVFIQREGDMEGNYQLFLLPMNPFESLMDFLDRLRKKLGIEGILHFFGILRQLSVFSENEVFVFHLKTHFDLFQSHVSENDKKKLSETDHYRTLFEVLKEIEELQIIRILRGDSETREIRKKMFVPIQDYWSRTEEKPDRRMIDYPTEKHYLADSFFYPNKQHPFHFGLAMKLLPKQFFEVSYRNSDVLPILTAYIYNQWFFSFPENKGTFTCEAEQMMNESGIQVARSARHRIIHRIKNALYSMSEKHYIEDFKIQPFHGNPWREKYEITAPHNVRQQISFIYDKAQRSLA